MSSPVPGQAHVWLEDRLEAIARDTRTLVPHAEAGLMVLNPQPDQDLSAGRVGNCIGQEVREDLCHAVPVAHRRHGLRRLEVDRMPRGTRARQFDLLAGDVS
jgi:hypothetical protein